ncbi:hypothetical protein PVAP13_9NG032446 [Panicum virgatum]|uniref:Uncharacterized protein n=1 Tax=Panicum virgatum TaxID=38727 RepID=A0A8T0MG69_PANVG|nr:hypothetical protein PVAP13_9NG032446 [Panicum virgatum]
MQVQDGPWFPSPEGAGGRSVRLGVASSPGHHRRREGQPAHTSSIRLSNWLSIHPGAHLHPGLDAADYGAARPTPCSVAGPVAVVARHCPGYGRASPSPSVGVSGRAWPLTAGLPA